MRGNRPKYGNPLANVMLDDFLRTAERQVEEIRENLPSILVRARTRMLERENEQLRKMIGK